VKERERRGFGGMEQAPPQPPQKSGD